MNAVKQIVNSNSLNGIVALPKLFKDKKVEIVITLIEDSIVPKLTRSDIESMLAGSITESLIGFIPNTGKTLKDYRMERLSKYEGVN